MNSHKKIEILQTILLSNDVVDSINENMDLLLEILPEIDKLISFDKIHQGTSIWKSTLCSLGLSKRNLDVRLSLLLNDISKPYTYSINGGVATYKGHASASSIIAKTTLSRIGYSESYTNKICYLIQMHNKRVNSNDYIYNKELLSKILEIQRCSNVEFNKEIKPDFKMSK